jgi:hypothetical protein
MRDLNGISRLLPVHIPQQNAPVILMKGNLFQNSMAEQLTGSIKNKSGERARNMWRI